MSVGVAQFRVAQAPERLTTMGLGSCLGIVLYDPATRVGALAHAMHPRRDRVRNNANRAKFIDSVLPIVVDRMVRAGARREGIVAKLFGGARMFESVAGSRCLPQIGDENIVAAREHLARLGVQVVAESVGGSVGRTIVLDLADGSVRVRGFESSEEIY